MICPKCKKEISDKVSICPRCGSVIEKKKPVRKNIKSKIEMKDESSLVGGTVSSFISFSKTPSKKKEIERKDFNTYIDYKEAKEKENLKKSKISNASKSLIKNKIEEESINKVNASKRVSEAVSLKKKNEEKKNIPLINKNNDEIIKGFSPKTKISQEDIYSSKDVYIEKKEDVRPKEINVSKEDNGKFFNNPGNVARTNNHISFINITVERSNYPNKENKRKSRMNILNFLAYLVVIGLWGLAITTIVDVNREDYYFSEKNNSLQNQNNVDQDLLNYNGVSKSGQVGGSSAEGITSIVYDNQYLKQMTFSNDKDVKNLIVADSVKQKDKCPADIVKIENEIINNYGITAVNLCEIDEDLALELKEVVKTIYNKYPSARNYLTNLTIANVSDNSTFIAAFMPSFSFGTSATSSGFPAAIKTQIILNATSFLNNSKFKSDVDRSTKSGYFPPNSTRSSTVAHEFGHYLSFVALLKHYDSKQLNFVKASQYSTFINVMEDFDNGTFSYDLLNEAYAEYKEEYPGVSFDSFRKSISKYAMAKDGKGMYIYDETIAEAFHDVYSNGENAKPASKYIVKVLERKL